MNADLLAGTRSNTYLRDYRHAARIFTDSNFRLSPKYGFLFYVEFDFNPLITNVSNYAAQELGMIVKSVSLPKYTVETKSHNAYNRVNIVQNKIKYDPITIVFHDDQADNVRNFWYDYYSFFYRDPDYADSTYSSPHKYQSRPSFDWGYSPRPTVGYNNANGAQPYQYIQAIRIYSLYQKNFSEYQLINPVITSFKHGEHVNGETSIMSHEMSIQFETVKYLTGYTTPNTVGGYVDLHYDTQPSPLYSRNQTDLVANGMGSLAPATDTITDLAGQSPLFGRDAPVQINTAVNFGPLSFGTNFGASTLLSTAGGINSGGFSIPSLGSLTQGITNGAILNQQLQAGAINIVGGLVSSAANGLIGGLAAGLGPSGGAIVGLAAQAIANPKAVLATATNMAASYAMQQVGTAISDFTKPYIDQASGAITKAVSENITQPIAGAWGDLSTSVSQYFNPEGWTDVGGLNVLNSDITSAAGLTESFELSGLNLDIDIPMPDFDFDW